MAGIVCCGCENVVGMVWECFWAVGPAVCGLWMRTSYHEAHHPLTHPPNFPYHPTKNMKQDITIYGIRAELFEDPNAARGLDEERHMIKWRGEVCL